MTKAGGFRVPGINVAKFKCFASAIAAGYKEMAYHNKTHAADLVQTINYYLTTGGLGETAQLDELEYLAILTSAAVHDFEHPGVNNIFLAKIMD
jgi:3',5'-cyclic-nucleotide phosphodiesterase